ncbi:melanocyte-stimulating hormone receptor-like [Branchiostoma floridae x Branchiostoma belcheri]
MENSTKTAAEESSINLFQCMVLLSYNLTSDAVFAKSLARCKEVGFQEAVGGPGFRIVTILFGLAIIVPNLLVVFGIVRGHVLHKPMYYFIGNIAVVDVLAGAVCLSIPLLLRSDAALSPIQALYTTLFFTLYLSLLGIALLSIDRYVSIHHGLFYNTAVRGRHAAAAVSVTWLGSALLCYSVMLGWNCQDLAISAERCVGTLDGNYMILLTAIILLVMLIVVQTNVRIFLAIKRRLQPHEQVCSNTDGQHISSAKKKVITLWIVVVIFFVCWMPFLIQIIRLLNTFYMTTMKERLAAGGLQGWGVAIAFCYIFALVNPVIYAFRLTELRNEVKLQLGKCWISVKRWFVRPQIAPSEDATDPPQIAVGSNSVPGVFSVPTVSRRVDFHSGVQTVSDQSEISRDPSSIVDMFKSEIVSTTRHTFYDTLITVQSRNTTQTGVVDLPVVSY